MGFTHADTGIVRSGGGASVNLVLSGAVGSGDLLVAFVEAGASPTITDSLGNTWTKIGPFFSFYYLAYVLSSASGSSVTITAATGGGVHQIAADRFTSTGVNTLGGSASAAPGTLGLSGSSSYNLGNLGTVPGGALAWGSLACDNTAGDQVYTAAFQTGSSGTADVIGSQTAGGNGTGFTAFVPSCSGANASLTWTATGTGAAAAAASMYFTTTSPQPPPFKRTSNLIRPVWPLPARGLIAANRGAPVSNPNVIPVQGALGGAIRAALPAPPHGRTTGRAGTFTAVATGSGPPFYPLRRPVRAQPQKPLLTGRTTGRAGTYTFVAPPPFTIGFLTATDQRTGGPS